MIRATVPAVESETCFVLSYPSLPSLFGYQQHATNTQPKHIEVVTPGLCAQVHNFTLILPWIIAGTLKQRLNITNSSLILYTMEKQDKSNTADSKQVICVTQTI